MALVSVKSSGGRCITRQPRLAACAVGDLAPGQRDDHGARATDRPRGRREHRRRRHRQPREPAPQQHRSPASHARSSPRRAPARARPGHAPAPPADQRGICPIWGPIGIAHRPPLSNAPLMGMRGPARIRLSRVIGALSYALDLTEGEPAGHAAPHLPDRDAARRASSGSTPRRARELFYALLLKDAGCSANSAKMAALFDADDHVAKRTVEAHRLVAPLPRVRLVATDRRARRLAARRAPTRLRAIKDGGAGHPRADARRAASAAPRSRSCSASSRRPPRRIRALDEHWDGSGQPRGLRGDEIPLLARILCLAQTAEIFHASGGPRGGATHVARAPQRRVVRPRAGATRCAPCRDDAELLGGARATPTSRPGSREDRLLSADDDQLDRIAAAFAGVIDAKSPVDLPPLRPRRLLVARHRRARSAPATPSCPTCAAPRCCTTSASSRSPTASSTSAAR